MGFGAGGREPVPYPHVYVARGAQERAIALPTDASGRLVQIVDPDNLAASFHYNGNTLTSVLEPDGGLTTFTYTLGHLSSIVEPGNRVLQFSYSGNGAHNTTFHSHWSWSSHDSAA